MPIITFKFVNIFLEIFISIFIACFASEFSFVVLFKLKDGHLSL